MTGCPVVFSYCSELLKSAKADPIYSGLDQDVIQNLQYLLIRANQWSGPRRWIELRGKAAIRILIQDVLTTACERAGCSDEASALRTLVYEDRWPGPAKLRESLLQIRETSVGLQVEHKMNRSPLWEGEAQMLRLVMDTAISACVALDLENYYHVGELVAASVWHARQGHALWFTIGDQIMGIQ